MGSLSGLVALIVIGTVVIAVLKKLSATKSVRDAYNYQLTPYLLTKAELSFYGVLKQAVGDAGVVFPKVRVADVLAPAKGQSRADWQKAFNKISAEHFDFVVCEPNGSTIRLAIELDDSSHAADQRAQRDEFLNNACRSAGLPLVRVKAASGYVVEDIRALLAEAQVAKPAVETRRAGRLTRRAEPTFSG